MSSFTIYRVTADFTPSHRETLNAHAVGRACECFSESQAKQVMYEWLQSDKLTNIGVRPIVYGG